MDERAPEPEVLIADKRYDAEAIRSDLERRGATSVISATGNRDTPIPIDGHISAIRNRIERCSIA